MTQIGTLDRALHLVDIENLTGCPRPTAEEVRACREAYLHLVQPGDHVVIACNHGAFVTVALAWPDARHLVRSGPDGADLALLDVVESEGPESRFASVTIATGDGIFAEAAARLAGLGVFVSVVVGRGRLSRRLQLAAQHLEHLHLGPPPAAGGRVRLSA